MNASNGYNYPQGIAEEIANYTHGNFTSVETTRVRCAGSAVTITKP